MCHSMNVSNRHSLVYFHASNVSVICTCKRGMTYMHPDAHVHEEILVVSLSQV